MPESIMYLFVGFGALLTIVGILIFVVKKGEGRNRVKLFGAEFEVSAPSLVIFVVGVMLMAFPFLGIVQQPGSVGDDGPIIGPSSTRKVAPPPEPTFKNEPYSYWVNMLQDNWWENRLEACNAMYQFGSEASSAVPILIDILETDIPKVRAEAALALSKIGAAARAAIPSLRQVNEWANREEYQEVYLSTLEALLALDAL